MLDLALNKSMKELCHHQREGRFEDDFIDENRYEAEERINTRTSTTSPSAMIKNQRKSRSHQKYHHQLLSNISESVEEEEGEEEETEMEATTKGCRCFQNQRRNPKTGSGYLKGENVKFTTRAVLIAATILFLSASNYVRAQCPNGTMTSFERLGSVAIKDSLLTVLYTAPNVSVFNTMNHHHLNNHQTRPAFGLDSSGASSAAANYQSTPITAECNNRCRRSGKCRAFLVDYARHTCYSVEQSINTQSSSGLMRTPPPINLVPTQERTSYFEKVCLNLPSVECERAWVYERVMGYHLHGYDDKIIDDVPSRLKCQEYCLNEVEFRCRSGEYDYVTMQCRLSMVDRHLKPNAFRPTANNVDYFENQCVPVGNQCDAFDQYEDMDLGRAEIMRSANTSDQCQQFCTQTIKAFICRSFTWNPITGKCYLNSANSFMVGGLERLIRAPGLIYYQRNDCIDLKLECDTTAMTLNLRTNEPFRGRMYVRDDPNACETIGRSSLTSSLSIPFQSHARCAVREPPNRFSSVVVVQQHPMIQRKSDRYIKVVCDFQTSNKTITSSYNVVNNPWTSTALINATSFAPKIKLRITDKFGVDITGAKLGDELYLRIEAETESVYDMVARSVLAKSGITDESIMLIDKDGCPTDFRIFPPLKKLNRRTIVGKFDAFKFSSDVVVRFQVDVQFCLNQCPSTSCDSNLLLNSQQQLTNDAFESTPSMSNSNNGQQQTTTSPLASSSTNLPSHGNHNNHDSSLVTAFSSTQPPVPFQQRTSISSSAQQQQQQTPVPQPVNSPLSSSAASNSNERGNNFSLNQNHHLHQHQPESDSYYYQAASSSALSHRHPSSILSAASSSLNQAANAPNFTGNPMQSNMILDMLTPTSDPQMFEQSQPRSAPVQQQQQLLEQQQQVSAKMDKSGGSGQQQRMRQKEQQVTGNSIDTQTSVVSTSETSTLADSQSTTNNLEQQQQQQQVAGNRLNRRRRSAEPMPRNPSHVPLQREIIVESTPGQQQQFQQQQQQNNNKNPNNKSVQHLNQPQNHRGAKSSRRDAKKNDLAAKADGLNRNGPAYDLNGNLRQQQDEEQQQQQQQAADNGTLLCTSRHSLVIASMAFCTVQLFTIALCFVTWMHKRDTKFKVKHPVEERLY